VAQRRIRCVSEQHAPRFAESATSALEELARQQHAERVRDLEELRAEVWESDEELGTFLADFRATRDASLG
jgi:hypothetical protein